MGILNITPDSFSDGGMYNNMDDAVKRAQKMETEGADIIDIGGESTGYQSKYVTLEEELNRIIPILKKIKKVTHIPVSVDTYKAKVAEEALMNGADMINDVTAFREDPKILDTVIEHRCPYIMMYSKDKTPRTTMKKKKYKNVTGHIIDFLKKRINTAKKQGLNEDRIILDPGMGMFISAVPKYSYEIIRDLQKITRLGFPLLIGASRKSFLMDTFESRDEKAKVIHALAFLNGASIIRTHDIKGNVEFFKNLNK